MDIVQKYARLALPEMEVLEMEGKTLKEYAREARKRMKSGFWEKMRAEKEQAILDALKNGQSIEVVEAQFKRRVQCAICEKEEEKQILDDEEFYEKVCKVLESTDLLMSPLAKLIDHEVYDKLSERDKQNYILKLSDRFIKMKERYAQEHQYNIELAY